MVNHGKTNLTMDGKLKASPNGDGLWVPPSSRHLQCLDLVFLLIFRISYYVEHFHDATTIFLSFAKDETALSLEIHPFARSTVQQEICEATTRVFCWTLGARGRKHLVVFGHFGRDLVDGITANCFSLRIPEPFRCTFWLRLFSSLAGLLGDSVEPQLLCLSEPQLLQPSRGCCMWHLRDIFDISQPSRF